MKKFLILFLCAYAVHAQTGAGTIKGTGNITITPLPTVTVTPPSVDFGNIPQNTSSSPTVITILNTGTTPLTITGISTSAPFAQSNNCPTVLAGVSSCAVNVTFTPNAVSPFSGTLVVTDNASPATQTSNLSGTGTGGGGTTVLVQGGAAQPASNYFVLSGTNTAIYLAGSHTWNDLQDQDKTSAPAAVNFNAYVNFLKAHGQNATVLWHKDLPTFCSWGAQGTWTIASNTGMQWQRTGPGSATDGFLKFDLTKFNQPYFDRLLARATQLNQNGIYAVVEMFDGLGLSVNRCNNDGYPFTAANNINGIDDGYSGGASGTNSMTGSVPNAFTAIQLAYIKKVIDTLNALPNVIWEASEEAPSGSAAWNTYMIAQMQAYEATKPIQHPILYATLDINSPNDPALYNSNATAIAPAAKFSAINNCSGTGTPHCKTNLQDSDHSYFGMWNDSAQVNRNYVWENFTNGANVVFMDPYLIFAGASNPNWTNRNLCDSNVSPASGVCTTPDTRWNNLRDNLGYTVSLGNTIDLIHMSAQPALASTGFALASNAATTSTFVVYAPNGGAFTVNTSAQPGRLMNVEWIDPVGGAKTSGGQVTSGSAALSFTPPWGSARDAVLHLSDAGPTPALIGWTKLANATTLQGNGFNNCPVNNFGGSSYSFNTKCIGIYTAWTSFSNIDPAGPNGPRMLSCANGGHSDYRGNECYEINPRTNTLTRLNNPGTSFPAPTCSGEGGTPPMSGHTYGFQFVSPETNKLYVWARIGYDTADNGCATFQMWSLDLSTVNQACAPNCSGTWAQVTPAGLPATEGIVMASATYNPADKKAYVFESFDAVNDGAFSVFDPVANTWTRMNRTSTNTTLYMSAGVDAAKQIMVAVGNNNDAPNPGGIYWMDISPGSAHAVHNAILDPTCNAITAVNAPPLTYDTRRQELVGLVPGNFQNFYIIDVNTLTNIATCPSESYGTVEGTSFPEHFNFDSGANSPMFHKFQYNEADDNYLLSANWDKTAWTLKRPPLVRISNPSGSTFTNVPLSVSEAFAAGDIAQFPQARVNGTLLTTQADVKTKWPDGSVKFAIVSFVLPSIGANATQKVYLVNQATGNNTGQLVKADLLTAPWNFDAQIQETGAANNTISARTILNACGSIADPGTDPSGSQNGACRYWLKGSVVTSVILEDRSAGRAFDFNSDGAPGTPLHPYYECTFYPQNNNADCISATENIWASSTATKSMRDQTYAFTLTGGNTSPVTLFTQASFNHIGRSRWMKHYCINGVGVGTANGCGPALNIDHNMAYEAYSKVLLNFDPTIILAASQISGAASSWSSGDKTIIGTKGSGCDGSGGVGQYCYDMNSGGTSPWFGVLNTWETMYWFSRGDSGMLTSVLGNTQVGGRIPFHYREADNLVSSTNLFYDSAGTVNPIGRTISVNARPMENWGIGTQVSQFNDTCSGANALTLNLGTVTDDGWISGNGTSAGGMDGSHWPEFAFTAALVTGKFYYIEEAQMSGAYMIGFDRGCPGGHRGGNLGAIWQPQLGRGSAWATRAGVLGWVVSPDSSPEQAYLSDKLQNTAIAWEGRENITNTDASRASAYNLGVADNDDPTHNPLHIQMNGWYGSFVEPPLDTTAGHLNSAWSPWEWGYLFATYGFARDAGLPAYSTLLNWGSNYWLHTALDPAAGGIFMVGTYRIPAKLTSSGTWIQSYTDFTQAFTQGNGSGLATSWTDQVHSQKPCNYSPEDDHWHAAPLAILGFLYPYTADSLNGRVAYDTVRRSLYATTGCMPAMFNNPAVNSLASPKWDILPRR